VPRSLRVFVEGGLYHVYNRFARGESVFSDPEEAIEFVELLREVKRRDGLTVFAWALLSNRCQVRRFRRSWTSARLDDLWLQLLFRARLTGAEEVETTELRTWQACALSERSGHKTVGVV
jgi:hypothetical protein